ncbi:hypothetical protein BPNSA17_00450 [Bordetella petrii]
MANRIDWIMSFIMCATLMAPNTLKAVDGAGAGADPAAGGGVMALQDAKTAAPQKATRPRTNSV